MNKKLIEKWEKTRQKGIFIYILSYWVLPLGIFAPIFAQAVNIYMKDNFMDPKVMRQLLNSVFLKQTAIISGVCIVLSIIFGYVSWNKYEKAFKSEKDAEKTTEKYTE